MIQKSITIKYNPHSQEGQIIDYLRASKGVNLSSLVRSLLFYARGYESIRINHDSEETKNFCICALQYFKGYLDAYQRRLNLINVNVSSDNLDEALSSNISQKELRESPQLKHLEIMSSQVDKLLP